MVKEDREVQLFTYRLSQAGREYCRGMLGLRPAMENREPIPGVLGPYCKNMQDNAAIAEILGLASMEENDEEEEMPEEHLPDEDSGFHIDHSIHRGAEITGALQGSGGRSFGHSALFRWKRNYAHGIQTNHKVWRSMQLVTERYRRNCTEIWRVDRR
jgi:hypothetical protein